MGMMVSKLSPCWTRNQMFSRLILYFFSPRPGINHFCKELFHFCGEWSLESKVRMLDVLIATQVSLRQQTEPEDVCVHLDTCMRIDICTHMYTDVYTRAHVCVYTDISSYLCVHL